MRVDVGLQAINGLLFTLVDRLAAGFFPQPSQDGYEVPHL